MLKGELSEFMVLKPGGRTPLEAKVFKEENPAVDMDDVDMGGRDMYPPEGEEGAPNGDDFIGDVANPLIADDEGRMPGGLMTPLPPLVAPPAPPPLPPTPPPRMAEVRL